MKYADATFWQKLSYRYHSMYGKVFNRIFPDLLKVYSHPRSGTHFLENFVGKNFYPNIDLSRKYYMWGHWSSRSIDVYGNPYGQLFGSHQFLQDSTQLGVKNVYIIRDPRAVALSIWRSEGFLPKNHHLSFEEFLESKLDWRGSPGLKKNLTKHTEQNIIEHWYEHVNSWIDLAKRCDKVLIVKYSDLVESPYDIYSRLYTKFFNHQPMKKFNEIQIIDTLVGLQPNEGKNNSWKLYFTDSALEKLYSIVSEDEINAIC